MCRNGVGASNLTSEQGASDGMKNVLGDYSSSEDEDYSKTKIRKIADLNARPAPKKCQVEEEPDLGTHLDMLTEAILDGLEGLKTTRVLGNSRDNGSQKASLTKSIMDPDCIAFHMMRKMGYEMGQSLGSRKNTNAIHEPIASKQVKGRAGIGAKAIAPLVTSDKVTDQDMSLYLEMELQKRRELMNKKTIAKLQDFCLRASGDDALVMLESIALDHINPLWRDHALKCQQEVMQTLRASDDSPEVKAFYCSSDTRICEDAASKYSDTATKLGRLLEHCRVEYSYCPYCEVQYDSKDDMEAHCPGKSYELHF